jgi:integrase
MPRSVRDANLETRTARSRLKARHEPYFRMIEPGVHLGYRKLAGSPGKWLVRRYMGDGSYSRDNLRATDGTFVIADDYSDADGELILTFSQAQERAKTRKSAAASRGSYTVNEALDDYFKFLEGEGKSAHSIYDTRQRAAAFIGPKLGKLKVAALTADRLRDWRDELVRTAPRLRTRKDAEQRHRELKGGPDAVRARRSSANRTRTVFFSALNHAFRERKVESDAAWRAVSPFRNVEAARLRYLQVAEAKRLINACDPEFRLLVQAALQTGARYGELCSLMAMDFDPDAGTLAIRQSKSGKPRYVILTDEGLALFKQLTAGRAGNDPMFGKLWGPSHQIRPMAEAVKRAKIAPAISFHGLRHTWASLAVMNGMPLMVVARNLGHVDTKMVEKHYSHLSSSYVAEAVRKSAPRFGFKPGNVRAL